jgi:hypothetical protein
MCEASGCIRATDIDFYNATTSDEFYFKNNYGYFNNIGLTTYEPFGMKVNSTGVSELRTLLQNQGYLLTGGETNIKYDAQAGWRIAKIGLEDLTIYSQLGQPSISYIGEQTSASYHGGIASATTYYYKVASLDRNFFTNTTSASTFTTTSSNAAIEMTINARNIPSILRIWRGTSAASMDRYVDIPVNEYVISIFDQGDVIGGYLWQTGGVPSITTYSNTSNILDYNGTIRASNATITDLISFKSNFTGSNYFESLKYANCDVKAYSNNGSLYCGTDATGLGGFTYANYFDQDLNKTSHVTFGSVNASLNASWVANPYWATLLSLIANITSLSGAIDSNLTKANSNIQANQTLIVNRESADNTTQAGLISSLDTRESANNQTQNSLIAGKASLTGAAFTGNIAGVNVSANLTVDASSGIYDTSANYFIWNGTCWDQAVGATHVYTCT